MVTNYFNVPKYAEDWELYQCCVCEETFATDDTDCEGLPCVPETMVNVNFLEDEIFEKLESEHSVCMWSPKPEYQDAIVICKDCLSLVKKEH